MSRNHFLGLAVACLLAAASTDSVAAAQDERAKTVQERVNRVGADLYSAAPHVKEAIAELKEILGLEPGSAEGHMLLGIAYRATGSTDLMGEAVAELRQALSLNPGLGPARVALARIYLDLNRAARAREELQTALAQAPGHPQVLALLAEAERQLGNPKRAVELARQALQADAAFVQARFYLGLALRDLGERAEAIKELEQVVRSGAAVADAYRGLGHAYLDAGRQEDAIKAFREAVRLNPAQSENHLQLARAYRVKGLLKEAEAQLKLAAPTGADTVSSLYHNVDADLYLEEGLIRLQQGRLEAAAQSFQKVLGIDASHEAARRHLADVRKRLQEKAAQKKTPPKKQPGVHE